MSDSTPPLRPTWPGPVPAQLISPKPVPCRYDVRQHPTGCVQVCISTDSAVITVYLPNEDAITFAKYLTTAASGLHIAGPDDLPPMDGKKL